MPWLVRSWRAAGTSSYCWMYAFPSLPRERAKHCHMQQEPEPEPEPERCADADMNVKAIVQVAPGHAVHLHILSLQACKPFVPSSYMSAAMHMPLCLCSIACHKLCQLSCFYCWCLTPIHALQGNTSMTRNEVLHSLPKSLRPFLVRGQRTVGIINQLFIIASLPGTSQMPLQRAWHTMIIGATAYTCLQQVGLGCGTGLLPVCEFHLPGVGLTA